MNSSKGYRSRPAELEQNRLDKEIQRQQDAHAQNEPATIDFRAEIRKCEHRLIARALCDANGSIMAAARSLGFESHNSLRSILHNRHRDLLPLLTPRKPRQKHLIDHEAKRKARQT